MQRAEEAEAADGRHADSYSQCAGGRGSVCLSSTLEWKMKKSHKNQQIFTLKGKVACAVGRTGQPRRVEVCVLLCSLTVQCVTSDGCTERRNLTEVVEIIAPLRRSPRAQQSCDKNFNLTFNYFEFARTGQTKDSMSDEFWRYTKLTIEIFWYRITTTTRSASDADLVFGLPLFKDDPLFAFICFFFFSESPLSVLL